MAFQAVFLTTDYLPPAPWAVTRQGPPFHAELIGFTRCCKPCVMIYPIFSLTVIRCFWVLQV